MQRLNSYQHQLLAFRLARIYPLKKLYLPILITGYANGCVQIIYRPVDR